LTDQDDDRLAVAGKTVQPLVEQLQSHFIS